MADKLSRNVSRRLVRELQRIERQPRNRGGDRYRSPSVQFKGKQWLEAGGRLTLTSASIEEEPQGDFIRSGISQKHAVFYAPFETDRIFLYTGTKWTQKTFDADDCKTPTISQSGVHDIFAHLNSEGDVVLEAVKWASDSARSSLLKKLNGVLVKDDSGSKAADERYTRRYLGTIYRDDGFFLCDSAERRWVWNFYNRLPKMLYKSDAGITLGTASEEKMRLEWVTGMFSGTVSIDLDAFLNTSGMTQNFIGSLSLSGVNVQPSNIANHAGQSMYLHYDSGIKSVTPHHSTAKIAWKGKWGVRVTGAAASSGTGSCTATLTGVIWC